LNNRTKFALVINLKIKIAKVLGIAVPPSFLELSTALQVATDKVERQATPRH
jgi:hypothetical protein